MGFIETLNFICRPSLTHIKAKFRPESRFFVENYDAATYVQQTQLMSLKSIALYRIKRL